MLHKPSLKVCVTNEEMLELRKQCAEFVKEARTACGKKISIEKILHDRQNVKNDKCKKAEDASVRNMKRWRQEQEDRRNEINEKREIKIKGLREELKRIEENKLVKRMVAIQAERDYLDEVEEIESRELLKENAELQRRINVYEKLNKQLDVEQEKREVVVEELKSSLKSTGDVTREVKLKEDSNEVVTTEVKLTEDSLKETLSAKKSREDSLNANEPEPSTEEVVPTDDMNNFVPKTNITERHRNKMKVLSHEYNFTIDAQNGNSSEVQPTNEKSSLTEAQRNKLKVMGHDYAMIEESSTKAPEISVQSCENMTDLQRNRLKVLSHEFNIEKEIPLKKMSLNLLQVEPPQQHLESPMSVTSDHFTNESDGTQKSSPEEASDMEKSQVIHDDDELEMLKAFEEAVEKNHSTFMGINLNEFTAPSSLSYEHIKTTDTMALSRFLQLSLMIPVNAYMDILNNETVKMFVDDLDILSHFKSLRNYFLMMNGEFSISICQKLFSKLESGVRPVELLNYQSLHTILDHALSRSRQDANTDQLSFIVQNIPEKFELHSPAVLNMLTMSYKLEWPLNLILNPETMEQYQAIFNYLLKLKRISWVLEECFQLLKELHKQHGKDLLRSQQFRNVQQTRHKMTHFVHCLENHVTRNVLQISWNAFIEDLKSAQSIHGIYRKHTSYLKRVLFLCLLNKKSFEFQKTIEDSFKVILKFHK
jgi:gamma-tubulin complex component 6